MFDDLVGLGLKLDFIRWHSYPGFEIGDSETMNSDTFSYSVSGYHDVVSEGFTKESSCQKITQLIQQLKR